MSPLVSWDIFTTQKCSGNLCTDEETEAWRGSVACPRELLNRRARTWEPDISEFKGKALIHLLLSP